MHNFSNIKKLFIFVPVQIKDIIQMEYWKANTTSSFYLLNLMITGLKWNLV